MEICEIAEAFIETNSDFNFDHTKLILRRGGEYFFARTQQRFSPSSAVDISGLQKTKIPIEKVWPPIQARFTRAPDPLPPNTYVKQPSLLQYGDTCAALELSCQVLTEVEACEILKRHPHPNIAQYLGCISEQDRIRGLCFVRYPVTLSQRLKDGTPFDRALCLIGIERGIRHMHELGLIHNDINPTNIMMDGDTPIIIDFDSCKEKGTKLGLKGGTVGWAIDGAEYAWPENDFYGLSKIRELLDIK